MNELKKLNKCKVARNAYYWQEGKRTPSLDNIYGLSQLFNVPMESILA